MLSERQRELIIFIVRDHIRTGLPIASERIHKEAKIAASPATIRNELGILTSDGFLKQAHTSSGRIPIQKAYRYFIDALLRPVLSVHSRKQKGGGINKTPSLLSELSEELSLFTALGSFGKKHRTLICGTTYLLAQPELRSDVLLANFAYILDHLRDVLQTYLYYCGRQERWPAVFIGKENPLPALQSFSVFGQTGANEDILLWVGPMRVDYERIVPTLAELFF